MCMCVRCMGFISCCLCSFISFHICFYNNFHVKSCLSIITAVTYTYILGVCGYMFKSKMLYSPFYSLFLSVFLCPLYMLFKSFIIWLAIRVYGFECLRYYNMFINKCNVMYVCYACNTVANKIKETKPNKI